MSTIDKKVYFVIIDYQNRDEIFSNYFSQFDNWTTHWGSLEELAEYDCVVTPGNSYGDLSGGFDLSIVGIFGDQIQSNLRRVLRKKFPSNEINDKNAWDCANQPIGTSILIETQSPVAKYLCHTPTMEYARGIVGKPNVYMAMNSILYEIYKHNMECLKSHKSRKNYIRSVIIPFLGTGFGELTYEESAKQISCAYKYFKENHSSLFK